MKYVWRAFKYSKLCKDIKSTLTKCGSDLTCISQSILHSQVDSSAIKEERWVHLFSESNNTIEVVLDGCLEVKYIISEFKKQETLLLENIEFTQQMKWVCKNKTFACSSDNGRFQISFYDKSELDLFYASISNFVNLKITANENNLLQNEILKKINALTGFTKSQIQISGSSGKTANELKNDFISLINCYTDDR